MKTKDIKEFVKQYYGLNDKYEFRSSEDRKEIALLKAFFKHLNK